MKIVVIGAGAMGTLFAGLLAKGGNNVTILAKKTKTEKILKKNGIKITGISKISIASSKLKITSIPSTIIYPDLIIIFVKAYDTISVMPSIKKMAGKNTFILTLQNGIGNYESISKFAGKNKVICGTTSESATPVCLPARLPRCNRGGRRSGGQIKYGNVVHTGKGKTVIGRIDNEICKEIVDIFNRCGIKTSLNNKIESVIWSKLVINCAINPVAAIAGVKNGDIAKYANLKEVAVESGKEAISVAGALGVKLLFSDVSKKIEDVCKATSENINSMLVDILAGRKTEIDYINGELIKIAKKLKIPVPVNKTLYKIVKKL